MHESMGSDTELMVFKWNVGLYDLICPAPFHMKPLSIIQSTANDGGFLLKTSVAKTTEVYLRVPH